MEKYGVLKIVASTGGLMFVGKKHEWLNPAKKLTPNEIAGIQTLKGTNVIVTFNNEGAYTNVIEGKKPIPTNPSVDNKTSTQTVKTEEYPKMNVSVALSKDYNTIKLELLDVEIKGDLSRRLQEKIEFLKTEINKAHDKIDGDEK